MEVRQGEIYWLDFGRPAASEPGYKHPCVVVQGNAVNRSAISTTIVCSLTTNLELGRAPGNVSLAKGEGGLNKASVVNVSQVMTVNKVDLRRKIGQLPLERVVEVLEGICTLLGALS